jgi:histidinol-phosphate aminotransferase
MIPEAPDYIQALVPYAPGKPEEELERELGVKCVAKLASNENALGPSPLAIEALREVAQRVHRYSDPGSYYLRDALGKKHGFHPDHVFLGNGSNELLELIARAYLTPETNAVVAEHAFLIFKIVTRLLNAGLNLVPMRDLTHDLEAMARSVDARTRVVFVANPNNPTGTFVGREEVERFIEMVPPNVVIVLDEAYYEYIRRPDIPRSLDYVRERENVVVLRTFSKAYGLAGLRIGFGIGTKCLVQDMNRVREPFNVNLAAQVAALAALQDEEHVRKSVALAVEGKDYMYGELDRMGVPYVRSETNFILANVGSGRDVYERLMKLGVIVRPMDGDGLHDYVRVSIGLPPENKAFIDGLERVMASRS